MNELMQEISPYLMSILTVLVSTLSVFLASKIKVFFDSKMEKDEQERLLRYVGLAVEYVEQIGKELDSEHKFELAKIKIVSWVEAKGLVVTDDEIEVLIESFVRGLKKEDL